MKNPFSFSTLFVGLFLVMFFIRFAFPLIYLFLVFYSVNRLMKYMMEDQARKQAARLGKEKRVKIEIEREKAQPSSVYDQIIASINQALLSVRVNQDRELHHNLIESRKYLLRLKEVDYKNHKQILENINLALKNYILFTNKAIKTKEVDEVIEKVEASIPNITYALKQMYLETIKDDLLSMDVQIDVLNNQLKFDGLTPSDFDKKIA